MTELTAIFTESDDEREAALKSGAFGGFPGWPPWHPSPRFWVKHGSKPSAELLEHVGEREYNRMGKLLLQWKRRWEAQR